MTFGCPSKSPACTAMGASPRPTGWGLTNKELIRQLFEQFGGCPLREEIRSQLGYAEGISSPLPTKEDTQDSGWGLPMGVMYKKKEAKSSGFF